MFPSQTKQDDIHIHNLSLLCRVCGGVKFTHSSLSVKVNKITLSKYVKKLYNVEVANEDSCIYPEEVCQSCERKLKRFYGIVSKRKKCSFSKDSLTSFIPHNDRLCWVCNSVEKQRIIEEKLCGENHNPRISTVGEDAHCDGNVVCDSETPRRNPPRKPLLSESKPSNLVSSPTQTENIYIDEVDGSSCKWFNKVPPKYTWKYSHKQIGKVKSSHFSKLRFKPLCLLVDKFCHSQKLNKIEALFFLLIGALQDSGDKMREVLVRDVWSKRNDVQCLSLDQCLAMRVLLNLNKETYKRQYSHFKEHLRKCVLKSPCHVDKHEKCFLPRSVDYHLSGASDAVVRQHTSSYSLGLLCKPHLSNVVHSRWLYCDVIAKTLQEHIHLFKKDHPPASSQLFKVIIKEHFEDKSTHCDGYDVPSLLPDCSEGRNTSPPQQAFGLRARLLTGYCTLVALQTADDSSSVKSLDESITGASRPFFRALYVPENRVSASGTRLDRQCAEQKHLSMAIAGQTPDTPEHQCPCASNDTAAACKTCTIEPNSIVTLNKSVRGSSQSKASSFSVPPDQHAMKPCTPNKPTSLLASQGHEPWLCPPPGAPPSVAVLLDVLQQERQELLGNDLHVVCPNSNTTYRFVVSFEAHRPETLNDYRNTRGLVRLHPYDEKSWLPRAMSALSKVIAALDSGASVREQGSEKSDAARKRGRMTSSGSQPPLLDMVRLFLASSPRLRATGILRTRGQRNTDSARSAGLPTYKPVCRRTVLRSAPRPQEERPLQRTEVLHPGEVFPDNSESRGGFSAPQNEVSGNTIFAQSASEGFDGSTEISRCHSKAGRDLDNQQHTHPSLQCSCEKECVMSDLEGSPYDSRSSEQLSSSAGHHGRQNIFIDNHYRGDMERADSSSESFDKLKRPPYLVSNQYPWSYSPLEPLVEQQAQHRPDAHDSAGYAAPHLHNDPLSFGDSAVMCYSHTSYPQMNAISISGAVCEHMDASEAPPAAQIVNAMSPVPPSFYSGDTYSNNSAATVNGFHSATARLASDDLQHHMTALRPEISCQQNGNTNPHNGSLPAASRAYTDPATALNLTPVNRSSHVGYDQLETSNFKDCGPPSNWH